MIQNLRFHYVALSVALAVVCLSGCRQSGTALTSIWKPRPDRSKGPALSELGSPEGVTAYQQADIEVTIARSLEQQGQIDRAIKVYLDAVSKGYEGADAYHRLAVLYDKKGKCRESTKFYQQALKIDPHNADVCCDQGYSYYLQQRWQEAEASLQRAIALKPDLARAHINLGMVLARSGRENEALAEFARAGRTEAEARANLAFALTLNRRTVEAEQEFEMALAADPTCDQARRGLDALRSVNVRSEDKDWTLAMDPREAEAVRTGYHSPPHMGQTWR
jgi:tetratricopeptide (TPR) repeat protein